MTAPPPVDGALCSVDGTLGPSYGPSLRGRQDSNFLGSGVPILLWSTTSRRGDAYEQNFGKMMKTQPGPRGGFHPPLTFILTFLTSKEFHEKLSEFENPVPTTTCWRPPCAVTCPLGTAQPPGHGSRSSVLAFQRIGSCAYWQYIAGLIDQGLCRLGLEFFSNGLENIYLPSQIKFVLQTTENSEKRVVEIQQTTSLPYFGVKLSCVCLMFACRKNCL